MSYIIEYNNLLQGGSISACTRLKNVYNNLCIDIINEKFILVPEKSNRAIEFIERFCKHTALKK